jgi:hypothetical protein
MLYRSYPLKLTELDLNTSGLFYPTTIRQLFTGIYFMELYLAGLFFLVRDADNRATCTAQAVIIIISTVLTALFHYTLDHGVYWLSFAGVLQKMDQANSKDKEQPDWSRKEDKEL